MIFEYSAKDASGEDKQGQIEAQNENEAVSRLQEQRLTIISISQVGVIKCPFCAEEIKKEAIICRFCGYDLKTGKHREVKARSTVQDGVNIGCGMFIVLPLIIIGLCLLPLALAGLTVNPVLLVIIIVSIIGYFWIYLTRKKSIKK